MDLQPETICTTSYVFIMQIGVICTYLTYNLFYFYFYLTYSHAGPAIIRYYRRKLFIEVWNFALD